MHSWFLAPQEAGHPPRKDFSREDCCSILADVRKSIQPAKVQAVVVPAEPRRTDEMCNSSLLGNALSKELGSPGHCWQFLDRAASADPGCGAAVACLVGLAIGDAVGAPLEFLSVDDALPDLPDGRYSDPTRSCLVPDRAGSELLHQNEFNKFVLRRGQWTDDTSMALCLADSLIVHDGYQGADARMRWHMWWFHGYCNAFRYDKQRPMRSSVGLGGNVSKSLMEVQSLYLRGGPAAVPDIYESKANDAGNGTIMRLAPVPIAYRLGGKARKAMEIAILQSRATHPSSDAAACCAFMTFFIVKAIEAHGEQSNPASRVKDFMDATIAEFFETDFQDLDAFQSMVGCGRSEGVARLRALLMCRPPSPKEVNWNWKLERPQNKRALVARLKDKTYNGHPIIDTYWGAYCMDGLAMALWGLYGSSSFSNCITRVVNLLGDADTTAAIAGQLGGALYGWKGITGDPFGCKWLDDLKTWDPNAEIGLRAALLYHHGPYTEAQIVQNEGHPAVRVFSSSDDRSKSLVGEIPSGSRCRLLALQGNFYKVSFGSVTGWVGKKNVQQYSGRSGKYKVEPTYPTGLESAGYDSAPPSRSAMPYHPSDPLPCPEDDLPSRRPSFSSGRDLQSSSKYRSLTAPSNRASRSDSLE